VCAEQTSLMLLEGTHEFYSCYDPLHSPQIDRGRFLGRGRVRTGRRPAWYRGRAGRRQNPRARISSGSVLSAPTTAAKPGEEFVSERARSWVGPTVSRHLKMVRFAQRCVVIVFVRTGRPSHDSWVGGSNSTGSSERGNATHVAGSSEPGKKRVTTHLAGTA
jgi:hypothetical protein